MSTETIERPPLVQVIHGGNYDIVEATRQGQWAALAARIVADDMALRVPLGIDPELADLILDETMNVMRCGRRNPHTWMSTSPLVDAGVHALAISTEVWRALGTAIGGPGWRIVHEPTGTLGVNHLPGAEETMRLMLATGFVPRDFLWKDGTASPIMVTDKGGTMVTSL